MVAYVQNDFFSIFGSDPSALNISFPHNSLKETLRPHRNYKITENSLETTTVAACTQSVAAM